MLGDEQDLHYQQNVTTILRHVTLSSSGQPILMFPPWEDVKVYDNNT